MVQLKQTRTDLTTEQDEKARLLILRQQCSAEGGTWNEELQQCEFTEAQQIASQVAATEKAKEAAEKPLDPRDPTDLPETTNPLLQQARAKGVPLETFRETGEGRKAFLQRVQARETGEELLANVTGQEQQQRGQLLAGQVGQVPLGQTLEPTPFDVGQGITQGLVNAIPRGLQAITSLAFLRGGVTATGAAAGAKGGGALAALGGTAGLVTGALGVGGLLSSSIISEFRGQRIDNINAQKRVLDEGKQVLNDLATLAASDPANRTTYLRQYNQVLGRIDQAYRQMKLDTNRDLAKFEKAVPDLAEFEEFYSGGERSTINAKMRQALITPSNPEYEMIELYNRRGDGRLN